MNRNLASCSRIADSFARSRQRRQLAFLPFLPAGFPNLQATASLLPALQAAGADLIEVGFPFSDPIADGPVIQEAFAAALRTGLRVADIFATVRAARPSVTIPLVAMVSISIVQRFGADRFIHQAASAGFDGLLVPDLPPPEARPICRQVREAGLDTILLVAPTTPLERRREILSLCSGFAYYLSVSGVTGQRDQLPPDLAQNVLQLKSLSDVPVCVGFGISRPEHLAQLAPLADGAIVGSALVRQIAQNVHQPIESLVRNIQAYCRHLLSALG